MGFVEGYLLVGALFATVIIWCACKEREEYADNRVEFWRGFSIFFVILSIFWLPMVVLAIYEIHKDAPGE